MPIIHIYQGEEEEREINVSINLKTDRLGLVTSYPKSNSNQCIWTQQFFKLSRDCLTCKEDRKSFGLLPSGHEKKEAKYSYLFWRGKLLKHLEFKVLDLII